MRPATGALLGTASSQARAEELDLHITATHLMDPSLSPTGGAIVLAISVVAPDSRGRLKLRSRDPREQPEIDGSFLSEERDRTRLVEGLKLSRELGRSPQLAPLLAFEMLPGAEAQDDCQALSDAVDRMLATYGHPVSTVPMGGALDPWGVVDSEGAVKGVPGLRVIDASIMREVTTVATNPTVVMIAEHLAARLYGVSDGRDAAPACSAAAGSGSGSDAGSGARIACSGQLVFPPPRRSETSPPRPGRLVCRTAVNSTPVSSGPATQRLGKCWAGKPPGCGRGGRRPRCY
jgi:choline dehydrogenase-like flavoprotein